MARSLSSLAPEEGLGGVTVYSLVLEAPVSL